ncbi:MAG: RtcB family protein [Patescibacteria group bacterium]|nr:RtcB family protein [Patescibacteria group bacterium]
MDQRHFPLRQISPTIWELPLGFKKGMRVPGKIIATKKLIPQVESEVLEQLANTAALPGVVEPVWAMPDTHVGYGAPVGAVFATDPDQNGVISPGAVGFDINCGIRLITTKLEEKEVKPKIEQLVDQLFSIAGAGVGGRSNLKLNQKEIEAVANQGVKWVIDHGFGREEDRLFCEESGQMSNAKPKDVSSFAFERGKRQLGSLGSGNHYLEVQKVIEIFDPAKAKTLGVFKKDQIAIMIHCGSRGFGHQIATDYLQKFGSVAQKYRIKLADRQLACAPINSKEGQAYFSAMACAANYAFANRQVLTAKIRQVFEKVFKKSDQEMGLDLIYDVAHNIAKLEAYFSNPKKQLLVHRKGATRAFGPGNSALPEKYRRLGQPVLIGGSMETFSYLMLGTKKAEELTFSSTCHGSGRTMSRSMAKKMVQGRILEQELKNKGIYIRTASYAGLAEEAGIAYKNIDDVVDAVSKTGICLPIAKLAPIGNVKG